MLAFSSQRQAQMMTVGTAAIMNVVILLSPLGV
jgi:hypothetical protein